MAEQPITSTKRPRKSPQSEDSQKPTSKLYKPHDDLQEYIHPTSPITKPVPSNDLHKYFGPISENRSGRGRGGRGRGQTRSRSLSVKKKRVVGSKTSKSPGRGRRIISQVMRQRSASVGATKNSLEKEDPISVNQDRIKLTQIRRKLAEEWDKKSESSHSTTDSIRELFKCHTPNLPKLSNTTKQQPIDLSISVSSDSLLDEDVKELVEFADKSMETLQNACDDALAESDNTPQIAASSDVIEATESYDNL